MALLTWPVLLDAHAHLREPGSEHKEDFYTASRSAIAGGFGMVLDMPNNPKPTISMAALAEKIELSQRKSQVPVGFHFGTDGHNQSCFNEAAAHPAVYGLKLYCNHTTGDMLVHDLGILESIFQTWPSSKPILLHAEGVELGATLALAHLYGKKVHVCHVALASEVELIRQAKKQSWQVTSGVCPHHLFLTTEDISRLHGFARMKPELGTAHDREALWQGLSDGSIDIVETDHAPHTRAEKQRENPASGVPGLETALPLLLLAHHQRGIALMDIQRWLVDGPRKLFHLPDFPDSFIQFDPEVAFTLDEASLHSKCGWSPFHGMKLYGQVQHMRLLGKTVLDNAQVLV